MKLSFSLLLSISLSLITNVVIRRARLMDSRPRLGLRDELKRLTLGD